MFPPRSYPHLLDTAHSSPPGSPPLLTPILSTPFASPFDLVTRPPSSLFPFLSSFLLFLLKRIFSLPKRVFVFGFLWFFFLKVWVFGCRLLFFVPLIPFLAFSFVSSSTLLLLPFCSVLFSWSEGPGLKAPFPDYAAKVRKEFRVPQSPSGWGSLDGASASRGWYLTHFGCIC